MGIQGCFSERVYLKQGKIDIPGTHKVPLLKILYMVSSIGIGLAIRAVNYSSGLGAVFAIAIVYLGKSRYLDGMAVLYEDMKSAYSEYFKWEH